MNELAISLFLGLIILAIAQGVLAAKFITSLRSRNQNLLPEEQLPKAAVILCLRGADPFLSNCLQALLNQNYPCYELRIVVDSIKDPAWKIVTQTLEEGTAAPVCVSPLIVHRKTCSLKCSALIQAISELDESFKVIALIDADTLAHPNWLREIVTPLTDRRVGITTGNRWYVPVGKYLGTSVRYLWNIAAVGQMYDHQIPWGGSLAFKTEIIHQTQLLQKWGQAFCEDTMLFNILREEGLDIKFVPSLIMLNREECHLTSFVRWVKRQLLNTRLYHPSWKAIVSYGLLTTLIPALAEICLLTALLTQQWIWGAWIGSGLALYIIALLILLGTLEKMVQKVIQNRGKQTTEFSLTTVVKILIALPITQLVSLIAILSALVMQKVNWRGITYQIKSPWDIHLVNYHPYQDIETSGDVKASL